MFNFLKKTHLSTEQLALCQTLRLDPATIEDIAITENGVTMWSCFRPEPTATETAWSSIDFSSEKRDEMYSQGLLRFKSIESEVKLSEMRSKAGKKGGEAYSPSKK